MNIRYDIYDYDYDYDNDDDDDDYDDDNDDDVGIYCCGVGWLVCGYQLSRSQGGASLGYSHHTDHNVR